MGHKSILWFAFLEEVDTKQYKRKGWEKRGATPCWTNSFRFSWNWQDAITVPGLDPEELNTATVTRNLTDL